MSTFSISTINFLDDITLTSQSQGFDDLVRGLVAIQPTIKPFERSIIEQVNRQMTLDKLGALVSCRGVLYYGNMGECITFNFELDAPTY